MSTASKKPSRFFPKRQNTNDAAAERQPAAKKVDTVESNSAVPILNYNEGISSNFVEWKKKIGIKAVKDYEDLGRCVKDPTLDYWEPEPFQPVNEVLLNQDATGNAMIAFRQKQETARVLKAQDRRDTALEEMEKKKPSLYAYIMSTLSSAS